MDSTISSKPGKWGRDVTVGDIFVFMGTPKRITNLRPYPPQSPLVLDGTLHSAFFVAESKTHDREYVWGITIDPDAFYEHVL